LRPQLAKSGGDRLQRQSHCIVLGILNLWHAGEVQPDPLAFMAVRITAESGVLFLCSGLGSEVAERGRDLVQHRIAALGIVAQGEKFRIVVGKPDQTWPFASSQIRAFCGRSIAMLWLHSINGVPTLGLPKITSSVGRNSLPTLAAPAA
jgi:hypothetical protein